MNFNRLLNIDVGKAFISFIIGIGIATIFRKVCKDGECITFKGPILSEISEDKIFKHNNTCYKYKLKGTTPINEKQTIDIDNKVEPNTSSGSKKSSNPFSFLTNNS